MDTFLARHWPAADSHQTPAPTRTAVATLQTAQMPAVSQEASTDEVQQPTKPKEKSVAMILAVFLGLFTWLYTYKKDAWKFWLNLALTIITFGLWHPIAWVWAMVDSFMKPTEFYKEFPNK